MNLIFSYIELCSHPSRNGLFVVGSRWDLTVGIRPFDHLHVNRLLAMLC